jgi:hypothetical protein
MLKIDVHPAVYFELEDSRSWYEECAKNLGNEFLCEVDRAFSAVQQAPLMWPGYDEQQGIRRFLIHRSPYAISIAYLETAVARALPEIS